MWGSFGPPGDSNISTFFKGTSMSIDVLDRKSRGFWAPDIEVLGSRRSGFLKQAAQRSRAGSLAGRGKLVGWKLGSEMFCCFRGVFFRAERRTHNGLEPFPSYFRALQAAGNVTLKLFRLGPSNSPHKAQNQRLTPFNP